MDHESLIGRTITGVERPALFESGYGEYEDTRRWLLRLDDGTAVEFAAEGYEVDGTTVTHLTPAVLEQRAREAEQARIQREEELRRSEEARARRQAHIEEMREKLAPAAFEMWRRKRYPTMPEVLKDVWAGPLQEVLSQRSRLLAGPNDG